MSRLTAVSKELQLAALAALALAFTLVLPWYQKSYFQDGKAVQANLSAFGVFTFVEAAVLLVAAAVLFLVWARSQQKGFHLPGGDGVAITLAGGWAMLLLVWRLFDKPDIQDPGATMGIQWGIFGAMVAAGALIVAGARVRALHAPEPPNPAADPDGWVSPARRERERTPERRPRDATAVTEMLRDRPSWEGDAREPPVRRSGEEPTTRLPDDPSREKTTRLPDDPSREETARLFDDPSRADTNRLDESPTRRLPDEPPRRERRRDGTRPLWDDDPR
jgi:hypothetical protein